MPVKELRRLRPDVFILEYDRWNLALGAVTGFATARRVAFRVLPNFDAWSQRTWWRELGKNVLFKAIDGAKVPGPDGAALATGTACRRSAPPWSPSRSTWPTTAGAAICRRRTAAAPGSAGPVRMRLPLRGPDLGGQGP